MTFKGGASFAQFEFAFGKAKRDAMLLKKNLQPHFEAGVIQILYIFKSNGIVHFGLLSVVLKACFLTLICDFKIGNLMQHSGKQNLKPFSCYLRLSCSVSPLECKLLNLLKARFKLH